MRSGVGDLLQQGSHRYREVHKGYGKVSCPVTTEAFVTPVDGLWLAALPRVAAGEGPCRTNVQVKGAGRRR